MTCSYGGMLAAYHRLSDPVVYQAAISASGPVNYILGTELWQDNAEKLHEKVASSLDVNSGNATCTATVRAALDQLQAAKSNATARALAAKTAGCAAAWIPGILLFAWLNSSINP